MTKGAQVMEIKLTSVSPVSFMMAKEGDLLEIKSKIPRVGEYRSRLGAPCESLLVFKNITKIGMIPQKIIAKYGKLRLLGNCRVLKMNQDSGAIIIQIEG
jgi:hypothetical protein